MQDAAQELGVTPGAISQRIRAVEERHGLRLFTRSKKGIALTAAGEKLHAEIGAAFSVIEAAHRKHFAKPRNAIRINAAPMFAYSVLVSGLGKFSELHPNIQLSVETENRLADLRSEPVDLAIRHGLGDYPGLVSEWLCSPELFLVCSPDLLTRNGPLETPADCLRYTLLPDATGKDWSLWFRAHCVDDSGARYGTVFKDGFMTLRSAIEGQGLALLSDVYVREHLASGRLVQALDVSWPTQFAYYAVGLPHSFERPPVRALITWLKHELSPDPVRRGCHEFCVSGPARAGFRLD